MTYFSVVQSDMHPAPHVAATGSARSAQILARLVGERCPGNVFGIREGVDFQGPKSNGFIRDCARSVEVQRIAADELMAEADDNPGQHPKWHVYFYDAGPGKYRFKVNAYLDHDLRIRQVRSGPGAGRARGCLWRRANPGNALSHARCLCRPAGGDRMTTFDVLVQAITDHAARAAEKLRQHNLVAGTLTVFSTPTRTSPNGRSTLLRAACACGPCPTTLRPGGCRRLRRAPRLARRSFWQWLRLY